MVQRSRQPDNDLTEEIMSFCAHIAGSCKITAACIRNDYSLGMIPGKTAIQILVVIHDFQPRLMNYAKVINEDSFAFLAVDEWVFERDVDRGFLGESLAGGLLFPYTPLENEKYLRTQEIRLKRRLILELLESLVLDFSELSYEFCIEPEYFMYETMLIRARLFPPMMYALASFIGGREKKKDIKLVLNGYVEALRELAQEGVITLSEDYVRISKEFADRVRSHKFRFINLFRTGQRALFASLIGVFPQILNVLSQNRESLLGLQRVLEENSKIAVQIEDPENHVYVSTSGGLVPLSNRTDIEAFARKVFSADKNAKVRVENIGGILNDVYLVKTYANGQQKKAVVKRFRDWSNFKWFPLTLWSVGTRTFAVLGSSRLERECGINQLLDSKGFAVPKVLYVSPNERLVFMEYVEGEDLSNVVRRIASSKIESEVKKDLAVIEKVGELFAKVHALGVALGDTKPENIRVAKEGKIYLTDFEQASRNGDIVWDIAEFLYYAGHDISPFAEVRRVEKLVEAFISGYLKAGGNIRTVKTVANPKYTKVFSVFTFPHIMLAISNVCRRADNPKE